MNKPTVKSALERQIHKIKRMGDRLKHVRDMAALTSTGETIMHHSYVGEIIEVMGDVESLLLAYEQVSENPLLPEQISPSMAKGKTLLLGAVIDDNEADAFADGWNACRAALFQYDKFASTELLNRSNSSTNSPVIPDGWKLVPIEPIEAMLVAGLNEADPLGGLIDWDSLRGDCNTREQVRDIYKAMLAAVAKPEERSQ